MPIAEQDPWRKPYFAGVSCPAQVFIPTEDADAYRLYPAHRWVYNKLLIAETQGLPHGPHGLAPPSFPVFSKPIYNMRGMGEGSRALRSRADYIRHQAPGHMWMALLDGEHVSSDAAVIAGRPVWWRHTTGKAGAHGTFDYWTIHAAAKPKLERYLGEWIGRTLATYTGYLNFETIGGRIIETHLRLTDQWPDLYGGKPWVEALVALYSHKRWPLDDRGRRTGYSVILFGPHGYRYRKPAARTVAALLKRPGVSSLQLSFHEDRDPAHHAMPPGGFRLAIVNCWDLDAGKAVRRRLAEHFRATRRRART
ncbi:MAG: hypothetical protein FJX61_08595 [Alphaproteobacteria bacterium]|nr:hypothetical protein [Alphaproteobacteria bacterium]